ncbi:hypothetical protein A8M77_04105 [Variovorax sp. JS1663]|nr:hypothetical protein A8M77_04105 [Variovorax sp. JS1663]
MQGNCDAAVIGGGLTGCSAALALAKKGARVVLLEAETIGHAASGRNGGMCNNGFAQDDGTMSAKPEHYDKLARSQELLAANVDPDTEMVSRADLAREVGSDRFYGGLVYARRTQSLERLRLARDPGPYRTTVVPAAGRGLLPAQGQARLKPFSQSSPPHQRRQG